MNRHRLHGSHASSAPTQPAFALQLDYTPPDGVYDELFLARGEPRPPWQSFVEACSQTSEIDFARRSVQADLLLRDNGVTFNAFGVTGQPQRPWRLDLLPMILSAAEFERIEAGLNQRARLFQRILQDLYGERRLIGEGWLPPEVVFAHPGFQRSFFGLHQPDGLQSESNSLVLYGAEIARTGNGDWWVMADRTESPTGSGFALENRIVSSRTMPPQMHCVPVQRLAPYFIRVQNRLKTLALRHSESPRIVLLSAGPKYAYYFEDLYLARYLGYTLVEGADLAVRDDHVYLKTLAGLLPVDVILSRGGESGIDPLELGSSASYGVPGLLHAIRRGNVRVVNTPGCGLLESPVFMAFLPALCRHLLGEELRIQSVMTWWCGDPAARQFVLDHLTSLVIKPAFQPSGSDEILPDKLSADRLRQLREQIQAHPSDYVAQDKVQRSAVPVWRDGEIQCGHVAVRVFLVSDTDGYSAMPGGLIRVAGNTEPMQLSIAAGDGSKDLWVLADSPVDPVTLLVADDRPAALRRTSALFPSRVADDLYWLGQSLDRTDFLCRLLRAVIERLISESENDWPELPVLLRALAEQGQIEPGFVIDSLDEQLPAMDECLPRSVGDVTEVRGVAFAVSEMLRLASLVRLWISPDTWSKIHQAGTAFLAMPFGPGVGLVDLLEVINQLIMNLASVSGLVSDGMIRGPAWRFLDMGRRIERGRDTSLLLKSLLTSPVTDRKPVLKALLEVLDCRMTYRSRYLDNLQQNAVLDLCTTDETNPRSVAFQVLAMSEHVDSLPHDLTMPLRTEEKRLVMSAVHTVRMISPEQLASQDSAEIESILTLLEQQLKNLGDLLMRKYLLHSGIPRQISSEFEVMS